METKSVHNNEVLLVFDHRAHTVSNDTHFWYTY